MTIPDYQTLMRPVLALAAERERSVREVVGLIADQFDLSPEEREQVLSSGRQTTLSNRVHWAATYMVKAGLLERPRRGAVRTTARGRDVLKVHPERVDNSVLVAFPEFNTFRAGSADETNGTNPPAVSSPPNDAGATPEERIDLAAVEMDEALRKDLLARILASEPAFFERLIVDLMLAMGYGGSGSGQHLGKTGDGGVDGVINEDPLGLDHVYLQAKRYGADNVVSVEKIREFAGSLDERGAVKGVFVTTSRFARSAYDYATRSPKRLVLIDGDELTRLCVRYDVGVRSFRRIDLKKTDEDYFANGEV